MKKYLFTFCSLLLLIYLILPGPTSIDDFKPLPNSRKSTEPGDTVQVSNVAGYYSFFFRPSVIPFYIENYQDKTIFPFPPLRLNYPPEFAFKAIKDQTMSTYLEELVYPFRDSIFINGFEPFYENGTPKYRGATDIVLNGVFYKSKNILRFYPSSLFDRVLVWVGINLSILGLWVVGKRIIIKGAP